MAARASSPKTSAVEVVQVEGNQTHLGAFVSLAREYLSWLGEDLGFQAVDDELDTLPGIYAAANRGSLLVAVCDGDYAGTAALRPLRGKQAEGIEEIEGISVDEIAELKRLYVPASHQRRGIGEALTMACIESARKMGYKAVCCDTLERLTAANALYKRMGFKPTVAYSFCPLVRIELDRRAPAPAPARLVTLTLTRASLARVCQLVRQDGPLHFVFIF